MKKSQLTKELVFVVVAVVVADVVLAFGILLRTIGFLREEEVRVPSPEVAVGVFVVSRNPAFLCCDDVPETLDFAAAAAGFFNKIFLPLFATFTGIEDDEDEEVEVVEIVDFVDTEDNSFKTKFWNQSVSSSASVGLELP
jgi:hypothetical protein